MLPKLQSWASRQRHNYRYIETVYRSHFWPLLASSLLPVARVFRVTLASFDLHHVTHNFFVPLIQEVNIGPARRTKVPETGPAICQFLFSDVFQSFSASTLQQQVSEMAGC